MPIPALLTAAAAGETGASTGSTGEGGACGGRWRGVIGSGYCAAASSMGKNQLNVSVCARS